MCRDTSNLLICIRREHVGKIRLDDHSPSIIVSPINDAKPSFRYRLSHHSIVVMSPNLSNNMISTTHEGSNGMSIMRVPHVCDLMTHH